MIHGRRWWGDIPKYLFVKLLCFLHDLLGGGFKHIFMFTPTWGRFPFWLIFFRMGWNHQPVWQFVLFHSNLNQNAPFKHVWHIFLTQEIQSDPQKSGASEWTPCYVGVFRQPTCGAEMTGSLTIGEQTPQISRIWMLNFWEWNVHNIHNPLQMCELRT